MVINPNDVNNSEFFIQNKHESKKEFAEISFKNIHKDNRGDYKI